MIKLNYGHINNDLFWGALEVLNSDTNLELKTSIKIAKFSQAVQEQVEPARKVHTKILLKHCEVDDQGKVKVSMVEDQGIKKPAPELKEGHAEDYRKDIGEFFNEEFEVDFDKFSLEEFGEVKLSGKMAILLAPIME